MSTNRRRFNRDMAGVVNTTRVIKAGATHTTEYVETPVRRMSFEIDVLLVSFLVFVLGLIVGIIIATELGMDGLIGIAGAAIFAGMVFFWRLLKLDKMEPMVEESHTIDETTSTMALDRDLIEEETPMAGLLVQIPTPRGLCKFYQPRVMEFAQWVRQVLRDEADPSLKFGEQVTLSKNRSKTRNWSPEMYEDMLEQLLKYNLVRVGPNRTPVPTDAGKHYFRAWLSGQTALPSKK